VKEFQLPSKSGRDWTITSMKSSRNEFRWKSQEGA
jgi:hypothetical protein